tara:strand:+ start:2518 stop:2907 length:390 start_codon:yes stop_codon:yes gene_type:complete
MKQHIVFGKIYTITNPDYPDQVYVGSTEQPHINGRKYSHIKSNKNGVLSYGNLFDTDKYECACQYLKEGLLGRELRKLEREYYDRYKSDGYSLTNQRLPWISDEEKAEANRRRVKAHYYRHRKCPLKIN